MKKLRRYGSLITMIFLLSNCSSDDGGNSGGETSTTVPEAQSVSLIYTAVATQGGSDVLIPGNIVTVTYEYYDADGDTEGSTQFNWYRADSQTGANKELVEGVSESVYTVTSADTDKYLSAEVIPVQSDGVIGEAVSSAYSPLVVNRTASWDGESVTTYQIVDGEFIKTYDHPVTSEYLSWQEDTAKHEEIIEQFKKIVPEEYFYRISEFTLFIGSDGDDKTPDTLGYVNYFSDDRVVFKFAIAIDKAYEKPFNDELGVNYTIAHEFGHVLTLNETQASTTEFTESACNNYFYNTCFFSDSYMNMFYQNYWIPILETYNQTDDYVAYYESHSDEFVSEYAASHPLEDIAETVMMYVLNSVNYTNSTIADQKVQSLDTYSDFQEIQTFATSNIPNSSLRAVFSVGVGRSEFRCGTNHD